LVKYEKEEEGVMFVYIEREREREGERLDAKLKI